MTDRYLEAGYLMLILLPAFSSFVPSYAFERARYNLPTASIHVDGDLVVAKHSALMQGTDVESTGAA